MLLTSCHWFTQFTVLKRQKTLCNDSFALRQEKNKTHKQHPDDSEFVKYNKACSKCLFWVKSICFSVFVSFLSKFLCLNWSIRWWFSDNIRQMSRIEWNQCKKKSKQLFFVELFFSGIFFFFLFGFAISCVCESVFWCACECNNFFFHCSHQYYSAYVWVA